MPFCQKGIMAWPYGLFLEEKFFAFADFVRIKMTKSLLVKLIFVLGIYVINPCRVI